jgi:hypothetical protein
MEHPIYEGKGDKRLFLQQQKSTTFFHARISRSGKGRVSNFSATRVRVEGVGSPEWQKRSRTRPHPQVEFEKWKKVLFFVKMGFSLPNWLFQQSFVVFDNFFFYSAERSRYGTDVMARNRF